ncbi:MAG TPA: SpoIID/LytB domain-containing protein, partial [Candidatus Ozemobacteraceae bacterium]|nr:SpoIID/LytB domain-containing protein [Candidatus Ozemobacteraceae bacterium]
MLRFLRFLSVVLLLFLGLSERATAEIEMKVRVADQVRRLEVKLLAGGDLFDERNRRVKTLRPNESFVWEVQAETKREEPKKPADKGKKDRQTRRPPARRKADPWLGKTIRFVSRRGQVTVNRLSYHGYLQVTFRSSGALVVNQLKLDDYIRGVVGREMGSLSPLESLKAQAVMARTWAVANRGKHGKDGFDVCNAEHCQVYGGMAAERATTTAAVAATRGVIMTAEG